MNPFLLHSFIEKSAHIYSDKNYITIEKNHYSFNEINYSANYLATHFKEIGICRGDRILIYMENSVDLVVSFWATLKCDAIVTIINPLTKATKLHFIISDCTPTLIVTEEKFIHMFKNIEENNTTSIKRIFLKCSENSNYVQSNIFLPQNSFIQNEKHNEIKPLYSKNIDLDTAAIIYTSGSTGEPKGVVMSHKNMMTAAYSISHYLELTNNDTIHCALPLAFDYGLYQIIMAALVGACVSLEEKFVLPHITLKKMSEEKATVFPGIPTMYALMQEVKNIENFDTSHIRIVTNTAATLTEKNIGVIKRIFKYTKIYSMYGLTECKRCTYLPPEDLERKIGSVGIPIPNTEAWVIDEQDNILPTHKVGQLVIRGSTVMKGYWNRPELTDKKIRKTKFSDDPVLYTGDLCKFDEEGYLYFVSRMDEMIKVKGEKVAPKEIERVVSQLPGVVDTAVIGVTDPIFGQVIKLFVSIEKDVNISVLDIKEHCSKNLEHTLQPKFIEILNFLPKTETGKIKKTDLQ